MDKKLLKMAADVMRQLSLTEIKIKDGDVEIAMKRETAAPTQTELPAVHDSDNDIENERDDSVDIRCPLIGVFYRSPSPSQAPYVNVGSEVKAGDVLCVIESMKMMTEITAECDGTVSSIHAEDGCMVEYGQPLFTITQG